MEDTHGVLEWGPRLKDKWVLILIIMEDTHGAKRKDLELLKLKAVLILIIMEDTHGEALLSQKTEAQVS